MKECFDEELHLNKVNISRLNTINSIIEEYSADNYILTLRQLYYQLVSRDIIPNNNKEYAKLSGLLVKGRMAGVVDWGAIEDRTRQPFLPYYVKDIDEAITDTISQYRLDRMENQEVYIELWVEKDALSNVLKRITSYYHINLVVNKGYSSCSAMYEAYRRIYNDGRNTAYILYLGDHDPSGLNMISDISARLQEFGLDNVKVLPIALTMSQIKQYNPPPNPTKHTDPRANEYIKKYGETCWEVDALNPKTLNKLLKTEIEKLIDIDLFNDQLNQEKIDIEKLKKSVKK